MGFLRRLLGGSESRHIEAETWPPPGPIQSWPASGKIRIRARVITFDCDPGNYIDVVGESHYQGVLESVAGGKTSDGARYPEHMAILLPEPDNEYDANAVRVFLAKDGVGGGAGGVVGYLSRDDAVSYRPVIDRVAEMGAITACHARLKGGWDRNISFGVTLLVGAPWSLMAELDRDMGPDARWPSAFKAVGDDGRPYNRTDCPYCGAEFNPMPKAKKACLACGGAVYVRTGPDDIRYLLRDVDLKAHDARWAMRR